MAVFGECWHKAGRRTCQSCGLVAVACVSWNAEALRWQCCVCSTAWTAAIVKRMVSQEKQHVDQLGLFDAA